jgi:hypothetical protein
MRIGGTLSGCGPRSSCGSGHPRRGGVNNHAISEDPVASRFDDDPIVFYHEVDDDQNETRRIELFDDSGQVPRLSGGPARDLPPCTRERHADPPVVKDGVYGSPPQQRFRCVGPVVNQKTGDLHPFHLFTPMLPRLLAASGSCDVCDSLLHVHAGPISSRSYAFAVREVAATFVAVGNGTSSARAADRARVSVGRRQLRRAGRCAGGGVAGPARPLDRDMPKGNRLRPALVDSTSARANSRDRPTPSHRQQRRGGYHTQIKEGGRQRHCHPVWVMYKTPSMTPRMSPLNLRPRLPGT